MLIQLNGEPEIDSSHVDWWIYSDIDVHAA
jgi:hypothetical protein